MLTSSARTRRIGAGVALAALILLAVTPLLFQRRTAGLRREIGTVHEPAREAVSDLQTAVARQIAAVRGLLLGNPELADEYQDARRVEGRAFRRLDSLAPRLDSAVKAGLRRTHQRVGTWQQVNDSLVRGEIAPTVVIRQLDAQQARYLAALSEISDLEESIRSASGTLRQQILDTERRWTTTSVALSLLAAASGVIVLLMMRAMLAEGRLARSDVLTGLLNRRGFNELARTEIARAQRYRYPVTMVCFDLNGFKAVNDTQGHAAGDRLLRDVAEALQSAVRTIDVVARLGGDEFAVLLPDNRFVPPGGLADQVRDRVGAVLQRRGWSATLSMGSVTVTPATETTDVQAMLDAADAAMYDAKRARRAAMPTGASR